MGEERLQRLRRRIRNLDAAILGMAAERMELAREIGQTKRRLEIPLRDFEVEREVLERAAETAAGLGLDVELASRLSALLIEEACRVQEVERPGPRRPDPETIAVIGGAGRMGGWLAAFFLTRGDRVLVVDPAADPAGDPAPVSLAAALAEASVALVATPLEATAAMLDRISELGFRGLLVDVASLKSHLGPALERARKRGARVASVHPMFGPGARTLSDKVLAVCDCGDPEATARAEGLFRDTALRIVPLSLERHDELVAYVLGLSHLVNLVFARALAASGLASGELETVASTTFRRQMSTTASVVGDNPELYYWIQRLNAFTPRVHEELRRAGEELTGWIERGEEAEFESAMREARAWLGAGAGATRPAG